MKRNLTAIVGCDGDFEVAPCPDSDVASRGVTIEAARRNSSEALELFLECASPQEIERRRRP